MPTPSRPPTVTDVAVELRNITMRYQAKRGRAVLALDDVDLSIGEGQFVSIVGPSGCGKSTLLKIIMGLTRQTSGEVVFGPSRSHANMLGMVFQQPNPFPKSIYDNVAFGLRVNGLVRSRAELDSQVESALRASALWEEAKDRLHRNALQLSGGEQQRLCIARALAVAPEVLLMDEPASALDPVSTAKIEELMIELKKDYTIVIVTHNMQQAARVSDFTAFLLNGTLVEFNPTPQLFTTPSDPRTEAYITGRFG